MVKLPEDHSGHYPSENAHKLTLGQHLTITAPRAIERELSKVSNAWLTHSESLLLNHPQVSFDPSTSLNPATLLPNLYLENPLIHDCLETLQHIHGTQSDLTMQPWPNLNFIVYMDGSSYIEDGMQEQQW